MCETREPSALVADEFSQRDLVAVRSWRFKSSPRHLDSSLAFPNTFGPLLRLVGKRAEVILAPAHTARDRDSPPLRCPDDGSGSALPRRPQELVPSGDRFLRP